jgi:hypothetical protein
VKLTVIFANVVHVVHAGGAVEYRRVTIDLTPEQAAALALRDEKWETRGPIFIEAERESEGGGDR